MGGQRVVRGVGFRDEWKGGETSGKLGESGKSLELFVTWRKAMLSQCCLLSEGCSSGEGEARRFRFRMSRLLNIKLMVSAGIGGGTCSDAIRLDTVGPVVVSVFCRRYTEGASVGFIPPPPKTLPSPRRLRYQPAQRCGGRCCPRWNHRVVD